MKKLKWVLFLLVAVPVALAVTAYAIIASQDYGELRSIVANQAERATGRQLAITGPLDLSISLTPSVSVSDLRFANAEWGSRPDMATINRFEIELALLPLIRGEMEVRRLVLDGADILLETSEDGEANWLFGEAERSAEETQREARAQMPSLQAVMIENSLLTYRDGATGETLVLALDETTLRETADRLQLSASGSYRDQRFQVEGETGLPQQLSDDGIFPLDLSGQLGDTAITLAGQLRNPMSESPGGELEIEVRSSNLARLGALVDTPLPDVGDMAFSGRFAYLEEHLVFEALRAEVLGARIEAAGDASGLPEEPKANLTLSIEGRDLAPLADVLDQDLPAGSPYRLAGNFAFEAGRLSFDALSASLADLSLEASGSLAGLPEDVTADIRFRFQGEELADLAALAGEDDLAAMGAFRVSGQLHGNAEAIRVAELSANLGENDLAGEIAVSLANVRPAMSGRLSSAYLDLTAFTTTGESAAETGANDDSPYVIPDTPLPLEALRMVDVDLGVTVGTLKLQSDMTVSDFELGIALANGDLALSPMTLEYSGGRLGGGVALRTAQETPEFTTDLTVERLDFGRLLRERDIADGVQGELDIGLQLSGRGNSPRAIASTLDGHAELNAGEGVITNRLLAIVASGLGEIMNPLFRGQDSTRLNCIIARMDFSGGVGSSRTLLIDTESFSVAGGGRVDLRDEQLDLHFDTSSRIPALVSLAVPFNVRGTMKNPQVRPDPLGSAQRAAELFGDGGFNPQSLLGGMLGAGQEQTEADNPCVTAIEGSAPTAEETQPAAPAEQIQRQLEDTLRGIGEGAGDRLRGLFGN